MDLFKIASQSLIGEDHTICTTGCTYGELKLSLEKLGSCGRWDLEPPRFLKSSCPTESVDVEDVEVARRWLFRLLLGFMTWVLFIAKRVETMEVGSL